MICIKIAKTVRESHGNRAILVTSIKREAVAIIRINFYAIVYELRRAHDKLT